MRIQRWLGARPAAGPVLAACATAAVGMAHPAAGVAQARTPLPDAATVLRTPGVSAALDSLRAWQRWTLDQQVQLTEIEAPPSKEQRRAEEYARRLRSLGYANTRIDAEGNVVAQRPGSPGGPVVILSGHLDTVFPEGTDVTVRQDGARLRAPGISDDGRGLAVVLAVARAFQTLDLRHDATIYFIGTVGEEGEGNLRGVRHLFGESELADEIDYFISMDGTGFGITHGAVGSNRYRVAFRGPGGHSYGAFGMPNPIHALGRAIASISELRVPTEPKTTFSVSVVGGGTSVNAIPMEGVLEIDMRSEDPTALLELDGQVRRALDAALAEERARWPNSRVPLTMELDTIGIRPAGQQADNAPIVRAAVAASEALGVESDLGASSTDSNIPISLGIPSLTLDGGGTGGDSHALGEWYEETPDAYKGPQRAALVLAILAGVR